jgi:hypothetical protein
VKTGRDLAAYLGDVESSAPKAAPFVNQGGLMAYLLSGSAGAFLGGLGRKLQTALEPVAEFPERPHRRSKHRRKSHPAITLHHMVMECTEQLELVLNAPATE